MTTGGIPYIMKFALSTGGLEAALSVLHKRKAEVLSPLEAKAIFNLRSDPTAAQPQIKSTKAEDKLRADGITEAQREHARRVLAKLGIK
jgi:hypothetical protein